MKFLKVILIFLCFSVNAQTIKYVTADGNSGNTGDSPATPWSLTHADGTATAGTTVYVKAGDYGSATVSFTQNGTEANPIKFIGYKNTPGDIVTTQGSTFSIGDNLDFLEMPLLDKGGVYTGGTISVSVFGSYVHLENFQITGGRIGINSDEDADHLTLKNIIVSEMGDQTQDQSTSGAAYDGFGIHVRGDYTEIINCHVEHCTAEGINTKGANNGTMMNVTTWSDSSINSMDYYFLISGGSSGWLIEKCDVKRDLGVPHPGHGFDMKDLAENNVIRECYVENSTVQVNFTGVQNNLFENITLIGIPGDPAPTLSAANGANLNTFRDFFFYNVDTPIRINNFEDGYVGPGGDRDAVGGGNNNIFEDFIVVNANEVIQHNTGTGDAPSSVSATGNSFKRFTVYNCETFLSTSYPVSDYTFENIGIHTQTSTNSINPITSGSNGTGTYAGSFTGFNHSNSAYFNATDGTWPSGWSNLGSPDFVNAGGSIKNNYKLQSGSPWIGAGVSGKNIGYNFTISLLISRKKAALSRAALSVFN